MPLNTPVTILPTHAVTIPSSIPPPPVQTSVPQQSTVTTPAPPVVASPVPTPSATPMDSFKLRINKPPAHPVIVYSDIMLGDVNIALESLALQQEDMTEDIILGPAQKTDCLDIISVVDLIGGLKKYEGLGDEQEKSLEVIDKFVDVSRETMSLGFAQKVTIVDIDRIFSQEIGLFYTAEGAAGALQQLSGLSIESLLAGLNVPELEIQTADIDRDLTSLGPDSIGLSVTIQIMNMQTSILEIGVRHENLVSVVTIKDDFLESPREYEENIDRVIALSRKAIQRIRSVLGESEIFTPGPDTGRFPELLKLLPVEAISTDTEPKYVQMNDYALIRDVYDIKIPTKPDGSNTSDYVKALWGRSPPTGIISASFVSGLDGLYASTPIRLENVGFDLFCVDAEIQSINQSEFFNALQGKYNPDATSRALKNQTKWPEEIRSTFTSRITITLIFSTGDIKRKMSVTE